MSETIFSDKLELKELVDTFSILADEKNTNAQMALFIEDAIVKSYKSGELISELQGHKAIGDGFATFLDLFDTVYHLNGQQTIEVDGDKANAISYCQVVLIGNRNDKRIMTTQGVRYQDEFRRVDGKWRIAARTSNFVWMDEKEIIE